MSGRSWPWLVLLTAVCPAPAAAEDRAEARRLGVLVGQLGSPRFADREAAGRALEEAGAAALVPLRQALRAADPEVRRRAARLVRSIERRLETARVLAPRRLRLVYRDTPLSEALADFGKRAGVQLDLSGGDADPGRKITLDTGEVTFWEALDQFCAAAGVVEKAPPPAPAPPDRMVSGRSIMFIGGRGMAPQPSDVLQAGADRPAVLHLTPGKPPTLPAHRAGAVRVRALPAGAAEVVVKEAGEVVAGLEAAVEPGLLWQRAIDLHVRRALDDQGQVLRPIPTPLATPAAQAQGTNIWIQGIPLVPEEDTSAPGPSRLAVRLRAGAKPSRSLRELSGTLLVQVQTPTETLVAVGDILAAAGRTVRGAAGGTVRVLEVERPEEGGVRLRVQVEGVPRSLKDNTPPVLNVSVMVDGRLVTGGDGSLNSTHFTLLDDRGQPLRVVRAVNTGKRAGNAQEYELTYRPRWGQGTPARFLYRDRRTTVVEVPFTLEDVPLP